MASSFIKPSERQSYFHRVYGKGEICYYKGHSTLIKFENSHEDLILNPLQGNKGVSPKYLWVTVQRGPRVDNTKIPSKKVKNPSSQAVESHEKDSKNNTIEKAITLLKREGYKIFKMVEV